MQPRVVAHRLYRNRPIGTSGATYAESFGVWRNGPVSAFSAQQIKQFGCEVQLAYGAPDDVEVVRAVGGSATCHHGYLQTTHCKECCK